MEKPKIKKLTNNWTSEDKYEHHTIAQKEAEKAKKRESEKTVMIPHPTLKKTFILKRPTL